jgi:hypothetical protein
VIDRLHPGGEQPVQLPQAGDVLPDLDQELVADGAEEPLDLPPGPSG